MQWICLILLFLIPQVQAGETEFYNPYAPTADNNESSSSWDFGGWTEAGFMANQ